MSDSPVRIGVVSFLNTLPLIDGLERLSNLELCSSVPSRLIDQLTRGEVEIGLCSSIDYQRSEVPLVLLPAGLLGCDGATMTVRLYSQVPAERIGRVHCDADSHTSIALLQILMREVMDIDPEIVEYDARRKVAGDVPVEWPQTMLLIGDKVVTDAPPATVYPHQLDLGELWRRHTGAPFVFAAWMARHDADRRRLATAAAALDRQRRHNQQRLDRIVHQHAASRNWPLELARQYLTRRLVYEYTPEREAALELFFRKAREHGLIERLRPV
jgi:chorismate dehydratase